MNVQEGVTYYITRQKQAKNISTTCTCNKFQPKDKIFVLSQKP